MDKQTQIKYTQPVRLPDGRWLVWKQCWVNGHCVWQEQVTGHSQREVELAPFLVKAQQETQVP